MSGLAECRPHLRQRPSGPRLVLFTYDFGGGTGNHFLEMMKHWDLDRWRPEIVAGTERTARVDPPVPVTQLPEEAVSAYPVLQLLQLRRLWHLVRSRRPEILHTYFFWPVIYGRILKAAGLVPRLVENREDTGFGWGRHEYALLRLTRSVPDRVICVSEAVRRVVEEREGLDPDRTTVVRNGVPPVPEVDPESVGELRSRYELQAGVPVVGMVANLNREVKGGEMFLRVASRVAKEVPDVRFLVVGLGGGANSLPREARRLGVESRVRFTGYTDAVDAHYELMDVSVLTSRTEGLSITLLESMSHGLPVVATRVGGNPEVVMEGETGWLVPVGDVSEFADRLTMLLRDGSLRSRMGTAARRRVRSDFDVRDVAHGYESVYAEVIGEHVATDSDHTNESGLNAGRAEPS